MEFRQITRDKKKYLPLLLLADEGEEMIDRYLDRGEMYALFDKDLRAVCVVTDEGEGVAELQNLAVAPEYQRLGYGRAMVNFLFMQYRGRFRAMTVGTGDSPMTLPFYRSCGFVEAYRDKGYMLRHYDHPIYEAGRQLTDRVVLRKDFDAEP